VKIPCVKLNNQLPFSKFCVKLWSMQLFWYWALIVSKEALLPGVLVCLKVWFCHCRHIWKSPVNRCCRHTCKSPVNHFKIQSLYACLSRVCYWIQFESWILLLVCLDHIELQPYNFDCQYLCPYYTVDLCVPWTHGNKGNWASLSLSLF